MFFNQGLGLSLAGFFHHEPFYPKPQTVTDQPSRGLRVSPISQGVRYVLGSRAEVRLGGGCNAACAHTRTRRVPLHATKKKGKTKYPGVSWFDLGNPTVVTLCQKEMTQSDLQHTSRKVTSYVGRYETTRNNKKNLRLNEKATRLCFSSSSVQHVRLHQFRKVSYPRTPIYA